MQTEFYKNNNRGLKLNQILYPITVEEMSIIRIEMESELYNQSDLKLINRNNKDELKKYER